MRTQTVGVVNGEEAIVIEHVNRMAADLAPSGRSSPAQVDGIYTIHIAGDPDIDMEMTVGEHSLRHRRRDGRHRDAHRERSAHAVIAAPPAS
ncbi:MAG: hypothetical protein U0W40_04360 [Acidimicrobiia bacterium]